MQDYNPSNKHNNLGKKLLIGGLAALVLTGSAIAYTQFAPNDEISPTPYNPPAVTIPIPPTTETPTITPTPTENQTPKETPISLEEKLADRLAPKGPLSDTQIEKYTLDAYEIAYNQGVYDKEIMDLAEESLGRVINSVAKRNFQYDELLALYKTRREYLRGELSGTYLVAFEEDIKKASDEWSKDTDKEGTIKYLRDDFFADLGARRGALSKQ